MTLLNRARLTPVWPPGPVTPGTEGWGTEWRGLRPQAPLTPRAQGQKRRGGLVLLPLGSGHGAGLLDPLATQGLWGGRPGGLGAASTAPRPGQDAAGPGWTRPHQLFPGRTGWQVVPLFRSCKSKILLIYYSNSGNEVRC